MQSTTLLLLLLTPVLGYAPSIASPPGPPKLLSKPTFVPKPKKVSEQSSNNPTSQTTKSLPPRYDLGLGKNKPVVNKKRKQHQQEQREKPSVLSTTTYDAARYWMIPEAVNNYPSPLNEESKPPTKKKILPKVQPLRMVSDELLDISGQNKDATALLYGNAVDLDVNTLWVEMLIHHQATTQAATA